MSTFSSLSRAWVAVVLCAVVAVASAPASAGPTPPDAPAVDAGDEGADPDPPGEPYFGQARTTVKYVPLDLGSEPVPLVIVLHGYSQTAERAMEAIPLVEAAHQNGWLLIAPSGLRDSDLRHYWNATPVCCDRDERGNDDVAYLRSVVEDHIATYPVDPRRVVVVGLSNGAFMAYRLACRASDLVVAVVTISGVEQFDPSRCTPRQAVSVYHIHGRDDRAVFFEGGSFGIQPEGFAEYPSAEETVQRWVHRNSCPEEEAQPVSVVSGSAGVWSGCDQNTLVRYRWLPEPHNFTITEELLDSIVAFIAAQDRPVLPLRDPGVRVLRL